MSDARLLVRSGDEGASDGAPPALQDTRAWRAAHAFCFLLGGTTFIAGTAALFPAPTPLLASLSAALYTLGSAGFLAVDVMEFFTLHAAPRALRLNILLSAAGSALYVVGSIGFFPAVLGASAAIGVWGFILGSALIGVSQLCKLARIAAGAQAAPWDAASACGVEGGAAAGAWLFLAGTVLYLRDASGGAVLQLWAAGSLAFTAGGACLAWRHFGLGLS